MQLAVMADLADTHKVLNIHRLIGSVSLPCHVLLHTMLPADM